MLPLDERRRLRFHREMKFVAAVAIGVILGLLTFAVSREVAFAFKAAPAIEVADYALRQVGSLRWIDTTLVTGFAAVAAAALSIRAIRDQIAADERAVERQLQFSANAAHDDHDARLTGARAVLPITLSSICAHAEAVLAMMIDLLRECEDERLPQTRELKFPELPVEAVHHLKLVIELSGKEDRAIYASLVGRLQIQSSRLRGLQREMARAPVRQNSIEGRALDAAEVYARASLLFEYGRFESDRPNADLRIENLANALHGMDVFSHDNLLLKRAKTYFQFREDGVIEA